jgi:SAM-dependent methyltransferase
MSAASYDPRRYWQQRLSDDYNLVGVGHRGYTEYYNRYYYRAKRRALLRCLRRHGITLRGRRVLDVGCGTGFFVEQYRSLGADVVGVDISEVAVHSLRRRCPAGCFVHRDAASEPLGDLGTFDLVSAWEVMMHVVTDDGFTTVISNLAAASRAGVASAEPGWVLLSDLLPPAPVATAPHVRLRSYPEYATVMRSAGLDIVEVLPVTHLLGPTFPRWRALRRRLEPWARRSLGRGADDALAPVLYRLDALLTRRDWRSCGDLKLIVARPCQR